MQQLKRLYLFLLLCLAVNTTTTAETFSYVYIQGDKQVPFYVKFEGDMLPRFGKNYYIISELAPGPISIEILFQQNMFPPQKFAVQIPENGFRGFLLMKKDNAFSLYDIQNQFYIPATNNIEDDKGTSIKSEIPATVAKVPVTENIIVNTPKTTKTTVAAVKKPTPAIPKTKPVVPKAEPVKPVNTDPKFLGNVELKNERTQSSNMIPAGGGKNVVKSSLTIVNSDCPSAMDNEPFDVLHKKLMSRPSGDRIKLIFDKMDNCFTSNQIRILAETLPDEATKYTLLKRAYARVTDQSAFARLENMFSSEEWKGYFRALLKR